MSDETRLGSDVVQATADPNMTGGFEGFASLYGPIVQMANDAIVITDAERRVAFANPAAGLLFNLSPEELVGHAVAKLTPQSERDVVASHESRALAGEPQRYETIIQRPDGERRMVSVSSAPLREGDTIVGVVASLRDITAERRARDAVIQSEARYRNLFDSASDAIYTLDPQANFTSVNRATSEITGYAVEELLGRSLTTIADPDELEELRENFRAARAGIPCRYEGHFFRADGERRVASVTNTPIYHGSDVVGVLGIARDITDERRRAAELQRARARYERVVESASDAIFTVNAEGRFTTVNEAMTRGLGASRQELVGKLFADVVIPEDRAAMWRVLTAALAGERQRTEMRFTDANHQVRIGSMTLAPVMEQGDVTTALGVVRDVTEERRLTEQLLQREKLAAVGQLVSGVAHELNNPLAGILAFSQLLMATPTTDASIRDAVLTINKEAKRAAKIISNLLLFARQRPPERTTTDLNTVVLDALELRRYALNAGQITVETILDPDLPSVWADPFQLQQVFLNLITNAEHALRDHSGSKRVTMETRYSNGVLEVIVSDSGPGVPPDVVDRIFNPFFSTKPVGEGTGLGLSISDGIIREHGGQIVVASGVEPGSGAVFIVRLPVTDVPDIREASEQAAPGSPPLSILLADDDVAAARRLGAHLTAAGHKVEVASSGREVLARMAAKRFDVILLDAGGESVRGEEVFTALLQRDQEAAARVVFTTGALEGESSRLFLRRSGRPVVRKPWAAEAVAELLYAEARRR